MSGLLFLSVFSLLLCLILLSIIKLIWGGRNQFRGNGVCIVLLGLCLAFFNQLHSIVCLLFTIVPMSSERCRKKSFAEKRTALQNKQETAWCRLLLTKSLGAEAAQIGGVRRWQTPSPKSNLVYYQMPLKRRLGNDPRIMEMWNLWQESSKQERIGSPHAHTHRGKTLRMQLLHQKIFWFIGP